MSVHRRTKKPSEVITYDVDFVRAIVATWRPGRAYAINDFIRPSHPNGFEYEATVGGQSDSVEPVFTQQVGATIPDGSVTWTCRAFGTNAIDDISTINVTPPTGISASGAQDGTRVLVTISGGTAGESYDIPVRVITAAGDDYEETIRVVVRNG